MGLFSSLINFGRRAVGSVGNVIRKVAQFSVPVVKRVAQFAGPVGNVAAGLGAAMGHPELARMMTGVSLASEAVHKVAPKVGQFMEKAGAWGGRQADKYGGKGE